MIAGLAEIADRYDALLCDVWGVVHNGRERHAAACEALVRFRALGGPVVLISNAPRRAQAVVGQLDALGVPRAAWSAVATSGDATRAELARRAPGPVWAIGPERDASLYEGLDLDFAGSETAAFICCTGLYDDRAERPEDYCERLAAPARRGLDMICANPDRVVQIGDRLIPCAGALADVYTALGGRVIMAGKPFAPIYDLAREAARAAAPAGTPPRRVLAIGDAVATDVKGANAQGLDCLFVAEGIHAADLVGPRGLEPSRAAALLAREGAHAAHLTPALKWAASEPDRD